jgi:hypothetical protein
MDAEVAALVALDTPEPITLLTLLDSLHQRGFSGAVTVHWRNGAPQAVEFVQTTRLKLTPPPSDLTTP